MPHYASIDELPSTIQAVLPSEAQKLYLEVYNQTWEEYQDADNGMSAESFAHQFAWDTVNKEFVRTGDGDETQWYRRGEVPPAEESDGGKQGLLARLKSIF